MSLQSSRLAEAIDECVEKGKNVVPSQIAREKGVPPSTLRHRLNGRLTREESHISRQLLNEEEEEALERACGYLAANHFPIRPSMLRSLAASILASHNRPPPGANWLQGFYKRHPALKSVMTQPFESSRADAESPDTIERWLTRLNEVRAEFGIHEADIYNMDEKGTCLGATEQHKVIVRAANQATDRLKRAPGRGSWVTILETISLTGHVLEPLVLFEGKSVNWDIIEQYNHLGKRLYHVY